MYIYKMVFVDINEIEEDQQEILKGLGLLDELDYGNIEISTTTVQDIYSGEFPLHEYEYSQNQAIYALTGLGTDVLELLKNGEIDFVQIIYG